MQALTLRMQLLDGAVAPAPAGVLEVVSLDSKV